VAATKKTSWQVLKPRTIPIPKTKKKIIVEKSEKPPSPNPSSSSNSSPEEDEITHPYIFPKKTTKNNASENQDINMDIGPST